MACLHSLDMEKLSHGQLSRIPCTSLHLIGPARVLLTASPLSLSPSLCAALFQTIDEWLTMALKVKFDRTNRPSYAYQQCG